MYTVASPDRQALKLIWLQSEKYHCLSISKCEKQTRHFVQVFFVACYYIVSCGCLIKMHLYMVMHAIVQVGYITRFSTFVTYTAMGTMDTGV